MRHGHDTAHQSLWRRELRSFPSSRCRHTARFLFAWLTLLPFALFPTTGWAVIPLCTGIAAVLCGIEEIGVQCEEPFGILPLDVICNRIQVRPHRRSCAGSDERPRRSREPAQSSHQDKRCVIRIAYQLCSTQHWTCGPSCPTVRCLPFPPRALAFLVCSSPGSPSSVCSLTRSRIAPIPLQPL
jgi:hypothetical protein